VSCIYNLVLRRRGINIINSDFHLNEYIGQFIPGHSIYRFFRSPQKRFVSRGDWFPFNLIVNYIYNLALTRGGINIIQSDFDWNQYIGYFIPRHSILQF
jgi:hypothetical protein